MKKVLTLTVLFLFLLFSATQVSAAVPCTPTVPAGGDIQAAITAANPGDVICLSPGIYTPSATININKSITLQGPQAGIDPGPSKGTSRTSGSSAEAIIDGNSSLLGRILLIGANNVVIDGIEVKSGKADMIRQDGPYSGTIVRYNIIHDGQGDEGAQLAKCTGCVMEYNYVYDIATPGDALNFADSTNSSIQYNEVRHIGSENAAIYVYGSTDIQIVGNIVYDVYLNDGIKLGAKSTGADATKTGGWILNNLVFNTNQDGITVYTSNTLVDGNEVYNSSSENGAVYVSFNVNNVIITNNYIHDNGSATDARTTYGIRVGKDGLYPTNVVVNNNCIVGNEKGLFYNFPTGAGPLNAENNWWGHSSGPGGEGSGSGDSVSANADYDPWLTSPASACAPANAPPVADPNGPYLGAVNIPIVFDGSASSDSDNDELTYAWDFGDGNTGTGEMPSYSYTTAGIYDVCLTVNDGYVDSEEVCTIAVVYDPTAGFVTGGGWINSPPGAYRPDLSLVGKATFGFVSKYLKGAKVPTGNTEFQFKAGNLNFHSGSYDWLVVNQAGTNAQFKGTGTINGQGIYKFMLWAGDGDKDNNVLTVDTFRIRIWSEDSGIESVVYDNGVDQPIGGGSIVIHKK